MVAEMFAIASFPLTNKKINGLHGEFKCHANTINYINNKTHTVSLNHLLFVECDSKSCNYAFMPDILMP